VSETTELPSCEDSQGNHAPIKQQSLHYRLVLRAGRLSKHAGELSLMFYQM
jgi:hypothetical protein